ncbi:tripartite motif-containing protein 2-like [Oculina patagonica]
MASSVEKELAKHLECGICLERFEEPKMLTCQHSYCKKCLGRLVTTDEITCPECKRKTEVPNGDVKSLPSNFLINNLLSIRGNNQSHASPSCEKHDGEIFKLFCQTCQQLICRDCTIIDHRNHKYNFIKKVKSEYPCFRIVY